LPLASTVLPCRQSDTVGVAKLMIAEKEGLPVEQQRLLFNCKQLEDEKSLGDYNLQMDSMLLLRV